MAEAGEEGAFEGEERKKKSRLIIQLMMGSMGRSTLQEIGEETLHMVKVGAIQRAGGHLMRWITALLELMKGGWKYPIGGRRKQL